MPNLCKKGGFDLGWDKGGFCKSGARWRDLLGEFWIVLVFIFTLWDRMLFFWRKISSSEYIFSMELSNFCKGFCFCVVVLALLKALASILCLFLDLNWNLRSQGVNLVIENSSWKMEVSMGDLGLSSLFLP